MNAFVAMAPWNFGTEVELDRACDRHKACQGTRNVPPGPIRGEVVEFGPIIALANRILPVLSPRDKALANAHQ